jgi:hypothetical protein
LIVNVRVPLRGVVLESFTVTEPDPAAVGVPLSTPVVVSKFIPEGIFDFDRM